jgi:hypothetical protein
MRLPPVLWKFKVIASIAELEYPGSKNCDYSRMADRDTFAIVGTN